MATPQSSLPKILTTTGAVTQKNYIQGKAGKLGEFHHTFGACVVELKNGLFHLRQINALDDGSFIDLTEEYSPHGVAKAGRALALVMGDTHQEFVDPNVVKATFDGPNSIVSVLKPQHLAGTISMTSTAAITITAAKFSSTTSSTTPDTTTSPRRLPGRSPSSIECRRPTRSTSS